jgi:hypothetical protein
VFKSSRKVPSLISPPFIIRSILPGSSFSHNPIVSLPGPSLIMKTFRRFRSFFFDGGQKNDERWKERESIFHFD